MYDTWLPNLNQQVLFERMMLDAIVWMVLAVLTIALIACLFYLASIIFLILTESESLTDPKLNTRRTGALPLVADSHTRAADDPLTITASDSPPRFLSPLHSDPRGV